MLATSHERGHFRRFAWIFVLETRTIAVLGSVATMPPSRDTADGPLAYHSLPRPGCSGCGSR
ncbi:hypothetical protein BRAO375_450008 [Bradyrhizobium sp. ORS 375]|nr:hypothetical protein BRAO375_450008 [Bradyrhizobium sp. ORS 375]